MEKYKILIGDGVEMEKGKKQIIIIINKK